MNAAEEILKAAIEEQKAVVERVTTDTREAREAGAVANRQWQAAKDKLYELQAGLKVLQKNSTRGHEVVG